jgi:dTDP-4-amino-4,6-dideoxygalactose transaminase
LSKEIYVTNPSLPSLDELLPYLQELWDSKILTNSGKFHQELERELCKYLGVPFISLFSNGTIALLTAIKCLRLTGEVITTPYSFIATSHSLLWNNIKPIFVDIEEDNFNIDPKEIERKITKNTSAILAVHVYGNPCFNSEIERIAKKYNLKVIYDAAHAFGVEKNGTSILNYGDLSAVSFHATKVFNTFEGGAVISHDVDTKNKIDQLKNFGIVDEVSVKNVGINGKMNEFNAIIGLLQLKKVDNDILKRKAIDTVYRKMLQNVNGIKIPIISSSIKHNYSYFPILITPEYSLSRDDLYYKLKDNNIFSRRYFYPLITNFSMYQDKKKYSSNDIPVANRVAEQILCLPIYPDLREEELNKIVDIISDKR